MATTSIGEPRYPVAAVAARLQSRSMLAWISKASGTRVAEPSHRFPYMVATLLVLLACRDDVDASCKTGLVLDADGGCVPLDDSGDGIWRTLPASCDESGAGGADPVTALASISFQPTLVEIVDLEIADDVVYAVGQGGLVILDRDPARLTALFVGGSDRFHRVEPLDVDRVAMTHRDRGLTIADVSDPEAPVQLASEMHPGWEGMSYVDGVLYVAVREYGVIALDVSDPSNPVQIGAGEGLSAPWELSAARDGWLYAADNALGVVPIDIADPKGPVVGDPVDLGAAVLHARVDGDYLYVSAGAAGVIVLDLTDPSAPLPVATVSTGGSVVMTAVAEGLLYAADHEGLAVFDVSDPTAPVPLGREQTPQFALAVDARDDIAWVADWTAVETWSVDRDARAPEAELSIDDVAIAAEGGSQEVMVANRGGGTLHLLGATSTDDRLGIEFSDAEVTPGDEVRVRLTYAGGADPLDAEVCISTDDADGPILSLKVTAGKDDEWIGQPAPDFALTDLDGVTHRLSEQLGHPVMLVYFASW